MKPTALLPAFCFLLSLIQLSGQSSADSNRTDLSSTWPAQWITHPEDDGKAFGVYHFKKSITLPAKPGEFRVHVSADNRYKLYVNGQYITYGPARGDQLNWRYETLDLAPYLKAGENVLAAVVWNFAEHRPVAQHSTHTGFILQGDSAAERLADTDSTWSVAASQAYAPIPVRLNAYYVVGPGEDFSAATHPWGWENGADSGAAYVNARELEAGRPTGSLANWGGRPLHVMVPRTIPLMEETDQAFKAVRRSEPDGLVSNQYNGTQPLTIAAGQKASLLLDQGHLTNAYPVLEFSGGTGSEIKITYAESLYHSDGSKGNRNEVEGKEIKGNTDIIRPDGGANRSYETLWWRTFRYVQIEVTTGAEPLVLEGFRSRFTGYPLEVNAQFQADRNLLDQIWEVGWRTQRLCAVENYFDCPYYEQLQYAGDTRIQCLVSAYVSGDLRLFRNALESYRDSRLPFGLTQSRYPSYDPQVIPTFSLVWITMVHDYWMLSEDTETVQLMLPGILDVLAWYERHMEENDLLGPMEWWGFVDWIYEEGWAHGVPPGAEDGQSALISLQLAYTLNKASELLDAFGYGAEAGRYTDLKDRINAAVREHCMVPKRGLLADTPNKTYFSQHTNALAILSGAVSEKEAGDWMQRLLDEPDIRRTTFYFSFYLFEALQQAGLADSYLDRLEPWEDMLQRGLTTFAERPEPTRSDCHAWSASPLYHFLSLVCGIQPAAPGFEQVTIAPNLNGLPGVSGSIPHPKGELSVDLRTSGTNRINGTITLPQGVTGTFRWQGQALALVPGENAIRL